jgi:hypothetical protein
MSAKIPFSRGVNYFGIYKKVVHLSLSLRVIGIHSY